MSYSPLVTIAVPVYGVEQYIERCAVSLFSQTYSNIEFLFVNDCTKDNSIVVLSSVLDRYPERHSQVRIVSHDKNKGVSSTRNTALSEAHGEFILWVDSDDWLENNAVELLVGEQVASNADVVLFGCSLEKKENKVLEHVPSFDSVMDLTLKTIRRSIPFHLWGRIYRKTLFDGVSFLSGVNIGEDIQVTAVLLDKARSISSVDLPLYHYNCQNESSYRAKSGELINSQAWVSFGVLKEYFSDRSKEYIQAVSHAELWCASCDLIDYVRHSGEEHYYKTASNHIESVNKSIRKEFGIERRVMFSIYKCKPLLKAYVLCADMAMRILRGKTSEN